ncbi:hypothetical protein [Streptomyces bacillaris]|uniref:hypothetical protein n=1 Tax=Streptomyces bacillaris TaxID=68179 RepID=UPI0036FE820F
MSTIKGKVHSAPGQKTGRGEANQLARLCGLSPDELINTLQLLTNRQAITCWHLSPETLELSWDGPPHDPGTPIRRRPRSESGLGDHEGNQ